MRSIDEGLRRFWRRGAESSGANPASTSQLYITLAPVNTPAVATPHSPLPNPSSMRIIFAGTPDFAVASLRAAAQR
ncbi:hypothetical protein BRN13_11505, partial [Xanthomonas oryzae pv. oryzae]